MTYQNLKSYLWRMLHLCMAALSYEDPLAECVAAMALVGAHYLSPLLEGEVSRFRCVQRQRVARWRVGGLGEVARGERDYWVQLVRGAPLLVKLTVVFLISGYTVTILGAAIPSLYGYGVVALVGLVSVEAVLLGAVVVQRVRA